MYFTGRPRGPLNVRGQHFPQPALSGSCCSSCAEDGGSCGGHKATGDFSTTVIGVGLVVGLVVIAMKTMNKAAG